MSRFQCNRLTVVKLGPNRWPNLGLCLFSNYNAQHQTPLSVASIWDEWGLPWVQPVKFYYYVGIYIHLRDYNLWKNVSKIKTSTAFVHEFLPKLWRLVNREHSAGRLSGPMSHTSRQLSCLTSDAGNCDQAVVAGTFTSWYYHCFFIQCPRKLWRPCRREDLQKCSNCRSCKLIACLNCKNQYNSHKLLPVQQDLQMLHLPVHPLYCQPGAEDLQIPRRLFFSVTLNLSNKRDIHIYGIQTWWSLCLQMSQHLMALGHYKARGWPQNLT